MPLRLDVPGDGTPPTRLYRRKSLKLTRAPSAQAETEAKEPDFLLTSLPTPKVPMEVLEQIIFFYAEDALALDDLLDCRRSAFRNFIKSCTLVSKDFRFLVLRRFFEQISFENTKHSKALFGYLAEVDLGYKMLGWTGGYFWVRSLSTASFLIRFNTRNLKNLTHLSNLAIDFAHSGLILQSVALTEMFNSIAQPNIAWGLTSLTLTRLPRIDVHLLTLISTSFPVLVKLHISSIEALDDCCPSCYENSQMRMVHSPVDDLYPDIASLTDAIGSSLAPLKNLTDLFIGVFLSRSNLLDLHITHAKSNIDMDQLFVAAIALCPLCEIHRKPTKEAELTASLCLARHLDSLKRIGWGTCFDRSLEIERSRKEPNTIEGSRQTNRMGKISDEVIIDRPSTTADAGLDRLSTLLSIARTDETIRIRRLY
ncbi:hypothetical protein JR316_0008330 [Psilocybe cubensis]|uniref:F-box domain-containing protein n=2 Tax=Psilocybe cubensis TaxID=181762 RepID=A0A8H7XWF6_PSICU|nr:hypothetical protein JR316_0008330 [Psilocybe cubensis]KAH9479735.1 hypothetical protein JR316_0008330 [Psilocybe cubensis]